MRTSVANDNGRFHHVRTGALATAIERLEDRLLMAATPAQIADALDLPGGVTVTYAGDNSAVTTRDTSSGGPSLFLIPSGEDGDYLILSSGDADDVTTLDNTGGSQGTDLGAGGETGDTATVSFSLPVPESQFGGPTTFKLDFVFLSEEYPEFVGSSFNDFFTVTVNGTNIAVDQLGNPVNVNNAFFNGDLSTAGTFFDGRTETLTLSFPVPTGVTTLDVVMSVGDAGDGIFDSAALIDNVRFQPAQVVYLDFDGADVNDFFGFGTDFNVPAFNATDIAGTPLQNEAAISTIVQRIQAKFAGYEIFFTSERPDTGPYMTVVVGGSNDSPISIDPAKHPILASQIGEEVPFSRYYEAQYPTLKNKNWKLYGQAQLQNGQPDIGNAVLDDMAVVFSKEFVLKNPQANISQLVNVIAHQVGNNLGLRDVDSRYTDDLMRQNPLPRGNAKFRAGFRNLAQDRWFDGKSRQNSVQYLQSIIGAGSADKAALVPKTQDEAGANIPHFKLNIASGQVLYDAVVGVVPHATTSLLRQDDGVIFYEYDKIDGELLVPLPQQYEDAKIFIYGKSTPGGPVDLFTGNPGRDGVFTFAETQLQLWQKDGLAVNQFALSKGSPQASTVTDKVFIDESPFTEDGNLWGNKGTFIDSDGDRYTVELRGRGSIAFDKLRDRNNRGAIANLVLADTNGESRLVIKLDKKDKKGGDNKLEAQNIEGKFLGRIDAPIVSLADTLTFDYVSRIDVDHIRERAVLTINSPQFTNTTSIDASIVDQFAQINVDGTVNLTAVEVRDGAQINAGAAGTIQTTGFNRASRGDFLGDISLNAEEVVLEGNAFNLIKVRGTSSGDWTTVGNGGTIQLGALARNLKLDFEASTLNKLVGGQLIDSNVEVERRINTVQLGRASGGSVKTGTIGTLNVTGAKGKKGFRGDFNTPLTLTGDFGNREGVPALQVGSIQSVANQTWDITGDVTNLAIGALVRSTLNIDGNAATLDIAGANEATVAVSETLGRYTSRTLNKSTVSATNLNSFYARDFVSASTLSAKATIGDVLAGALLDVDILAAVRSGFDPDTLSPTTKRGDVFESFEGRIKSVRIDAKRAKNKPVAFTEVNILAFNVGTVTVAKVNPNNLGDLYGIGAVNLTAVNAADKSVVVPPGGLQPPAGGTGAVPLAGDFAVVYL